MTVTGSQVGHSPNKTLTRVDCSFQQRQDSLQEEAGAIDHEGVDEVDDKTRAQLCASRHLPHLRIPGHQRLLRLAAHHALLLNLEAGHQ